MSDKLKRRLEEKTLIFDGAMGTEIYRRNFFVNTSYESLCLSNPKVVKEIHESYKDAGAEVFITNSYGANSNKLSKFGLGDKVAEINAAAVRIAREVAGDQLLVAGSVGPVGESPSLSVADPSFALSVVSDHVASIVKAGADFVVFETLINGRDLACALKAMESFPDFPFVVSLSLDRNAESAKGEPASLLLSQISSAKVKPVALGVNCGIGPEAMLGVLETVVPNTELPVIAQPNAGIPKSVDNRMIYMCSPEYFTTYALRFINLGVRGVGGCCGTGPEHIRDMARSVNPLAKASKASLVVARGSEAPLKEPVPTAQKSSFAAKLASGKWVSTIEIVPPQGYMLEQTIAKAKQCKDAGVDAINIPDGPRASSRVSPMVTAARIQREAGIEAILHFCCRDKNLIGMQADLLGCASLAINNILFITGDPPKLGDYPFASAVFDVDSIGMVKIVSRMNRGVDIGGKPFDPPTKTLMGVGADPNAIDMAREVKRTREKLDAGAEFLITQPVFSVDALLKFLDAVPELSKIPVIAGIWPLASYRNAEFMRNEVPGVVVPDSVMARMAAAKTKEEQRDEGIKIARESVEGLKGRINGIQVSAPFGNVGTAIAVIGAV